MATAIENVDQREKPKRRSAATWSIPLVAINSKTKDCESKRCNDDFFPPVPVGDRAAEDLAHDTGHEHPGNEKVRSGNIVPLFDE
jgi:hypothetical protein